MSADCPPGFRLEDGKCVPETFEIVLRGLGDGWKRVGFRVGQQEFMLSRTFPEDEACIMADMLLAALSKILAAGRAEHPEACRERANVDAASIEIQQETIRLLKADLLALQKRIDDAPRAAIRTDDLGDTWIDFDDSQPGKPKITKAIYLVALVPVEPSGSAAQEDADGKP